MSILNKLNHISTFHQENPLVCKQACEITSDVDALAAIAAKSELFSIATTFNTPTMYKTFEEAYNASIGTDATFIVNAGMYVNMTESQVTTYWKRCEVRELPIGNVRVTQYDRRHLLVSRRCYAGPISLGNNVCVGYSRFVCDYFGDRQERIKYFEENLADKGFCHEQDGAWLDIRSECLGKYLKFLAKYEPITAAVQTPKNDTAEFTSRGEAVKMLDKITAYLTAK